jgi:hypothetical protein
MTPEGYLYSGEAGPEYSLVDDWGWAMVGKTGEKNLSSWFPK